MTGADLLAQLRDETMQIRRTAEHWQGLARHARECADRDRRETQAVYTVAAETRRDTTQIAARIARASWRPTVGGLVPGGRFAAIEID